MFGPQSALGETPEASDAAAEHPDGVLAMLTPVAKKAMPPPVTVSATTTSKKEIAA
jgi:hypothetical protein